MSNHNDKPIGWTMTSEELELYTTKVHLDIRGRLLDDMREELQRANDRIELLEKEAEAAKVMQSGTDKQVQELLRDVCKANDLIAKLRFPKLAS